jgi:release factor glutamine methyltransferase
MIYRSLCIKAHALPELNAQFDLVASNPPYVASDELDRVKPEVRHDPAVALGAGSDGLDIIRAVESAARRLLRPGGLLIVEHSDRQGRSAPAVFADQAVWADVRDHLDHDGLDRFVTAVRR